MLFLLKDLHVLRLLKTGCKPRPLCQCKPNEDCGTNFRWYLRRSDEGIFGNPKFGDEKILGRCTLESVDKSGILHLNGSKSKSCEYSFLIIFIIHF